MKDLAVTRDEAEILVDLLEEAHDKHPPKQYLDLADEIRQLFGMTPRVCTQVGKRE